MRRWSLVLHLYQPPTIDLALVETVLASCYLPLFRLLAIKKNSAFTLNISGSLLIAIKALRCDEFINLVNQLYNEGKIELLNSPLYHPVIPITPKAIVERQIAQNAYFMKSILGIDPGQGFFPPELAVDQSSLDTIGTYSNYAIVSDTSTSGVTLGQYNTLKLVTINGALNKLFGIHNDRLEPKRVMDFLDENTTPDSVVVSAHDAELFGHHFEERIELLEGLLDSPDIRFCTVADTLGRHTKTLPTISTITPSSWQLQENFSLWNGNSLQKKYLKLAILANRLWETSKDKLTDHFKDSATDHLDRGWSSCHLYWLSNSPWWHPDLAERGANNLIRCIRTLPIASHAKVDAEKLYHELVKQIWLYHWSAEVKQGYANYDKLHKH